MPWLSSDGSAAERKAKLTGKARLGEKTNASPAILRGRIYLRGKKHLFAIGAKP